MTQESPEKPHKSFLLWLTELSGVGLGVLALLYVCGFLAHTVHYRLLGVDVGAQPLNYLTFAGDFFVSVVISVPQSFWLFNDYKSELMQTKLWLPILLCILSLLCIGLLKIKTSHRRVLGALFCLLIGFACTTLLGIEFRVFNVQNAFQPFSPVETQSDAQATSQNKVRTTGDQVRTIKESYEEHEKLPEINEWKKWFDPLTANNQQNRTRSYLAFLFLNTLLLITLIVSLYFRRLCPYPRVIIFIASAGFLLLLLLTPCLYATLGRVYTFPVVRLNLETDEQHNLKNLSQNTSRQDDNFPEKTDTAIQTFATHPVFLIAQDEAQILVYDRLNLFQVKRIGRSKARSITQLYISSPFDNCQGAEGFVPCESLWLKDTTPILDF
jgi:hypothetical protein